MLVPLQCVSDTTLRTAADGIEIGTTNMIIIRTHYPALYKTNMTDILDLPVCIKRNPTGDYFRTLVDRAKAKGIYRKDGMDACNGIWFEVEKNGKRIRYTLTTGRHALDGLVVE